MLLSVTMAMTMMPIMTGDGLNEEDNDDSEDNSHGDSEQYVNSDESDNVHKGKNKVLDNLSADHPWCIRIDWHEIE